MKGARKYQIAIAVSVFATITLVRFFDLDVGLSTDDIKKIGEDLTQVLETLMKFEKNE